MKTDLKETYKNRINSAIALSNYLNNPDITIDSNNLRYFEDQLIQSMASFLNEANKYINEMYRLYPCNLSDSGLLKKEILNTITCITGATLSFGKGLSVDKYVHILNKIVDDLYPDEVLE